MKILFVTLCALETNTSVTKSNYGILKGLVDCGHQVTLLMPEIDINLSYFDDSYQMKDVSVLRIKNNSIGQKIATISNSSTGLKKKLIGVARTVYGKCKVFDRTKELIKEAPNFEKYDEYYDVVISTSDPKTSHMFVAEMIKNGLKYGRWIQHWGDPLAGDISRNSIHPEWLLQNIEKNILKNADRVVYVSPFTREVQKKRYPSLSEKLGFVPLACDEYDQEPEKAEVVRVMESALRVVYLGDYSSKIRNILPLYEACCEMPDVSLTIAGNTDLQLAEKKNIRIYPRIPQEKAKALEDAADVIVSVGNLNGNQIPGKIYYAASSKKTILVTVDGDFKEQMCEYITSYDRFTCCDNTKEAIKASLKKVIVSADVEYKTPERLLPVNVAKEILDQ